MMIPASNPRPSAPRLRAVIMPHRRFTAWTAIFAHAVWMIAMIPDLADKNRRMPCLIVALQRASRPRSSESAFQGKYGGLEEVIAHHRQRYGDEKAEYGDKQLSQRPRMQEMFESSREVTEIDEVQAVEQVQTVAITPEKAQQGPVKQSGHPIRFFLCEKDEAGTAHGDGGVADCGHPGR